MGKQDWRVFPRGGHA